MDFGATASWIFIPLQIFFLDLLLGADNAVVIALACRSLHRDDRRMAILLGTAGAILLRLILITAASFLLSLPYLKLVGALLLIGIAINLVAPESGAIDLASKRTLSSPAMRRTLGSAALIIVLGDATMSFDNIVALAAVARGNIWLLAAGLAFSIPVLMLGSLFLSNFLRKYPSLVIAGCCLLGWIAGDLAVSDPIIADWANNYAPALVLISPVLGAVFVFVQSRFLAEGRQDHAEAAGAPVRQIERPAQVVLPDLLAAPERGAALVSSIDAVPRARHVEPRVDRLSARPEKSVGAPSHDAGDRFVLPGFLLLAAVAGGMIGYLLYLDALVGR